MQQKASLVLLLSVALPAPSVLAADVEDLLSGYSLTSWNDSDSRPLGSVNAIVQDGDGYLWVGSDAGLFRFDGSRFTAWEVVGDTPLPPNAVRALCVSRDGSLWVGLADGGGLHRIRDGRVQPQVQLPEPAGSVTDVAQDNTGTVWAVSNRVLYRFSESRWDKVALPWEQREGLVLQPYVSSRGDLWVGTRWGVFRRDAKSDTFQIMSHDYVFSISEDPAGNIWTTDIASGFKRLGAASSVQPSLEGAGSRVMHDRKGNLWIATFGKGLWRVLSGAETSAVKRLTRRSGLFSDSVQSLTQDRDGNIWIGTTGGLHRLTERALTPLENVGFVLTVEMDQDGHVWGGTSNGVVRFSATPTEVPPTRIGSPGLDVRALYSQPRGPLWVGTTNGLWQVIDGTLSPVPLSSRPQMQVLSITPAPAGGLLLGDGDRLFRWNGARLTALDFPGGPAEGTRVTIARTDRSGRVWAAFAGGRLGYLEPHGSFRMLGPVDGLGPREHSAIHAIFQDVDDVVWIGGSGGLSRFDRGRIVTLNAKSGLPGTRVWAIVEDTQRYFWLSVDRGVVRVARHEVEKALTTPSYRMHYRLYDTLDGLAGAAIGTTVSMQARDGTLWFVRGGGVTLVRPSDLSSDLRARAAAPVRIETIVANERPFNPGLRTTFASGTARIQISYSAVALSSSNNIRFRHRLEGFDTAWINAGTRRTAFYTNLSPGDYRFQVEASAEDGSWNTSAAAWGFSIQPAFYQTNWFYLICVAAAALSVWGAWRFRLRLVRQQFSLALAERTRLSREIHDTLLQSLVGVAMQFDAISSNLGPSSASARRQLIRVRRQVVEYIREARQSILNLRSPLLETRELPDALREFGRDAVADTPTRFVSTITGTRRQCSPRIEKELLRIGQEAITNAVGHAGASQIHLEMAFEEKSVTLRVFDDGRGFDYADSLAAPDRHYGLTTMRERAEELGGRFSIASEVGRGTVVEAVVPTSIGALDEIPAEI